ncbi:MAG: adenine deaminase [Deltaproteobacteria bacterium]|nr:adenine deaminase [Deltaproteobacteria bacterium]
MSDAEIIRCARGETPADLLLKGGRIVDVFSGEIVPGDIAVKNGTIVGIGPYRARQTVELDGRYVTPGFIDAHVHIESAMTGITEFARAVVARGTTTVIADPHEIANVLGGAGIRYMLAASEGQPVNVFFMLPACVPATDMETAGARLTAEDLRPFMSADRILGLAEMMNYPGVLRGDPEVMRKLALAGGARKTVDGHAPGLTGADLNAYVAAGIASDHECTTLPEAREKLRAGMHIMVREGTAAKNLAALLPLVNPRTCRRMMWCTDDRHAHDLLTEGHIDFIVRSAVGRGLDPVVAVQMATLNPAEFFGLRHLGAVAPGRRADLLVIDDLHALKVDRVFSRGRLVAVDGRVVDDLEPPPSIGAPFTMRVPAGALDFAIPATGRRVRVIEIVPDQIVTRAGVAEARIEAGRAVSDPSRDLLKIAVVERHSGAGRSAAAFVRGLGLKRGAVASSVAHDAHNIIVAGVSDRDMSAAVETVVKMGGGLAVVADGRLLAELALPIAGLMSASPLAEVAGKLDRLTAAARSLGSPLNDPFMTLSFLALPVIPALKLTDRGLVDVEKFEIVQLFVE